VAVLAGRGFSIGIRGFRLFPPGFAGNDKTTARWNLFSSTAPFSTATLTTMRCHIFPVQHKNETTKPRFGSD
jgi:hypothetical protein